VFATWNTRALGLDWPAAATIDIAAAAGFPAVDLMLRDIVLRGEPLADLRLRLDDLGLTAAAFPLPIDWRDDLPTYDAGLALLPTIARAAAQLGLTRTATWVLPSFPPSFPATHPDALLDWHLERLAPVVRILHDHGVQLGLEALGTHQPPESIPFIRRLADLTPLLNRLGPFGTVGLALDTFHAHAAGESIPSLLHTHGPHAIVAVHLADIDETGDSGHPPYTLTDRLRSLPHADGLIPNAQTLESLARAGYSGPVMAETFHLPGAIKNGLTPVAQARRVASALKQVWPSAFSP
jgi:sugar phosphate isomerase/epimerase